MENHCHHEVFYSNLTFRLTVIIAAVFARRSGRTPGSAAPYRPFVDMLITLFTTDHHDVKLQKPEGYNYFGLYQVITL